MTETLLDKIKQMKAIWNGQVVAESESVLMYEGVYYFPIESIKSDFIHSSDTHTFCTKKGNELCKIETYF